MSFSPASATIVLTPYPPSRLARVSPTGPAPRISTSVSKGFAVEPFWDVAGGGLARAPGPGRGGAPWRGKSWLVLGVSGGQGRRSGALARWPWGVLAVQQEVEVDLVEGLRVLVLGPVTAVLHHRELRAGDQRRDPLCLGDRPRRVLC